MRKSLVLKDKEVLKELIDILSMNYDGFQPDIQVEVNDESYSIDEYDKSTTNVEMKIVINTWNYLDNDDE